MDVLEPLVGRLATAPWSEEITELQRQIASLERRLEAAPSGPSGPPDSVVESVTTRKLTIVDEQGFPVFVLEKADGLSTIEIFHEPGKASSYLYDGGNGGVIILTGDGTSVCIWSQRVEVCETDEDGFLDFKD